MNAVIACLLALLVVKTGHADSTKPSLPDNVVKVTGENNAKCAVFLTYKGELYCSFVAPNDEETDPQIVSYEQQNIHFDDRLWKPVWGQKTNAVWTVEYIPVGDNIDHWKELVTSQFLPGLDGVTLKQFKQKFIADLQKTGVTYSIDSIDQKPDQLIFEFKVTVPVNLQQDEIQKITRGKKGIYVLHYAIKKANMNDTNRLKWIKNLQSSTIKE
ncbi:hypothetical protein [Legionella worsleiensis]|uniref:Secreted protein n=1 Tax=Legionella worsleiensis TaxID=45076 RepID=A0A0W1AL34_9GAMM|nr:hypothetical protein [Legionella worsleiensis]KTD81952.1 hypothetical protein Lwor_0255 [Legionella worsleiensis]STY31316.1 Uncharacterised protein [Legionella worsleiensis]